jgi:hypothetical protein
MCPEKTESTGTPVPSPLDENQVRRLRVTFEYIDTVLADIEEVLDSAASRAAFPRIIPDIPSAQRMVMEDTITRIRGQLIRVMEDWGVPREPPSLPASRIIDCHLTVIGIALEELKPRPKRGHSTKTRAAGDEVSGTVCALQDMVAELGECLGAGMNNEPEGITLGDEQHTAGGKPDSLHGQRDGI